jgi:hypothetical protein
VVPALFRAEPAELAVVLFRAPLSAALFRALVAVVRFGVGRVGVLFTAGRADGVLSAAFGRTGSAFGWTGAAFGAALTAGVLGSLSITASCHALRLGTSGELSR